MSSFKRSQAKYVKQTHKIANWPAYDQALVARGSLTFWFTDEAISKWTAPPSGKAGGQRKYPNLAIEPALAFRMVFHLPWRQTKGCLQSLVAIHGLTLEIPHQTTFSRRAKGLGKVAFHSPAMTDRFTSSWTVPASRFIAGTCASRPRTALGASSTVSSMRILVMSPPVIWEAAKLAMRLVYPRCSSRSSARWHGSRQTRPTTPRESTLR